MSKKNTFGKNKSCLSKKVVIYAIMISLIISAFVSFALPDQIGDDGCVRNFTYWRDYPDAWPVEEITIGEITYDKQDAIDILNTLINDDMTISMFYKLAATKLNIANGAGSGCIETIVTEADAWMRDYGPAGSGVSASSEEWNEGEPLHNMLYDYIKGLLCVPSCDDETGGGDGNTTSDGNTTDDGDDDQKTRPTLGYTYRQAPIADANGPYYGIIGELIEFDGSNSYDKDGEIIEYLWNFGDETTGSGKIVTHSYAKTGRYRVTLTVIDNYHLKSSPNTTSLTVIQPNRPPSIPEIFGPSSGKKDATYSYAATSSDLDNDDLKYIFDWGDGNKDESEFIPLQKGTSFSIKHSWDKAGKYTITVTVSDSQSTSSSSEMIVLIEENIATNNIVILGLGILAIIALMIYPMYNKKGINK